MSDRSAHAILEAPALVEPKHARRDAGASRRPCKLIVLTAPHAAAKSDFETIGGFIRELDPGIETVAFDRRPKWWELAALLRQPALTFAPIPLGRWRPLRGPVFCGRRMPKSAEYVALQRHNFPVPKWALFTEHSTPDLTAFPNYVVTKPDFSAWGAHVKIRRKGRVRWEKPPASRSLGQCDALLAQEFIYTGPRPVAYRVTTLFGQVLWSFKITAGADRPPLEGPDAFNRVRDNRGVCIVASSRGCVIELDYDEEIIRLGEAASAAFPEIPNLGFDIIREVPSGKLYIVEANTLGFIWHFSSEMGLRAQREFGFSLDAQFGGLRKAARILAEKTRQLAR
jgi:hypothetical protein